MRKMRSTIIVLAIIPLLALSMQVKASCASTDFENGLEYWALYTNAGGTVQVSTAYAHSGTHSVEQIAQPIWDSKASIRLLVTSTLNQYELSAWVYVTERTTVNEGSRFGFIYDNEEIHWNAWGSSSSYVGVRQSEGYQVKGDFNNPVPYGLTLNTWHQVNITTYTNSGKVSVWLDGDLIVDNWPAFNAGEHPDYYVVYCYSSGARAQQYIDGVTTSEMSESETPLLMQWWFWTIIALGAIVAVLVFTTFHYRGKPSTLKETSVIQSKPTSMEYKVCPNCGASLPADSKFCGKCGTSLK